MSRNNGRVVGRSCSGSFNPHAKERREPAAPRYDQQYFCASGHVFTLTFYIDAQTPSQWVCPNCGGLAPSKAGGPVDVTQSARWLSDEKTPLSRLYERRTPQELESLLGEALTNLRGTGRAFPSAF
jgi:hypothetical protein